MIENKQDCKDVITQLSASRSAIDRTIGLIVSMNLEQCVRENIAKGESTKHLVHEAVDLLVKSRWIQSYVNCKWVDELFFLRKLYLDEYL